MISLNITLDQAAELTGIPAATLAGLRAGSLVAVPRGDLEMMRLAAITANARMSLLSDALTAYGRRIDAMLAASEAPQ